MDHDGLPGERSAGRGRRGRTLPTGRAFVVAALGVLAVAACGSAPTTDTAGGPASGPTSSARTGSAVELAEPAPAPGSARVTGDAGAPTDGPSPEVGPPATPTTEPAGTSAPATGPAPAARPLTVGSTTLALVDATRPTVGGGTTRSTTRSLPTTVFFPTDGAGPWPLVVFAHGYRLGPPGYERLTRSLASAGYVVAAPSFPLADEAVAGAAVDRGDIPNQSRDVAFVIDGVVGASSTPGSPLSGRVDGMRIGAVGHSDGADTVLDVGYVTGRSDARVRAIVALAPDAMAPPGASVGGATPLLVEHGDADSVVPYTESITVFGQVRARRFLLTLIGADHLAPVAQSTPWTPLLDATIVAFLDRYVADRTTVDDAIVASGSAPGLARIEDAG